jgi:hypothetical protein
LTPHKLSEGCLEWCSFICVVFGSGGWLRCDGVFMFWAGVHVWCYIVYYYYYTYYTIIILYLIYYIVYIILFLPSPLPYSSLLLCSILLFPISTIPIFILYLSVLTYTYLYSFFYSPLLFSYLLLSSSPLPNIQSILVGTYIYLFIFFPIFFLIFFHSFHPLPSFPLFLPNPSIPSQPSVLPPTPHFILYLSVLTYTYLYSSHSRIIWPRTFYRSGWLRCVVRICGVFWWMVEVCRFELVSGLTLGVTIINYILLYYYYIIIHILLLYYYTLLYYYCYTYYILYSSPPNHLPFSYSPHPILCSVLPFSSLIHSILVGTYIYLFILFLPVPLLPIWPRTFYRFCLCFELVFRAGVCVIIYYVISYILYYTHPLPISSVLPLFF